MSTVRTSSFDPSLTRPSWAPDGSRFAVEVGWKGYLVDKDGTNATRFGPADTHVTNPSFSPDGDQIAFGGYSSADGEALPTWRLFLADANGENAKAISANTGWHPTWSPDSRQLLFFNAADDGSYHQRVINRDGTGEHRVSLGKFDVHAAWSPDGGKIAYDSLFGVYRIQLVNPDGSGTQQLTPVGDGGDESNPQWSPDGKSILFEHNYLDSITGDLAIVPVDGSADPRPLTVGLGEVHDPVWSPDGTRVAFEANTRGSHDIYVINADGSDLQRVTTDDVNHEFAPSWSPDGTRLAYLTRTPTLTDGYGIATVAPAGA